MKSFHNASQMELTEELYDLLCKIFDASIKTRHDLKRKYFAEILAHSIELDNSWEEAEQLVRVVSDLELIHIKILDLASSANEADRTINNYSTYVLVSRQQNRSAGQTSPMVLSIELKEYSQDLLKISCSELVSKGLLKDIGSAQGFGEIGTSYVNESMEALTITDSGRSLLDWILTK